MDIHELKNAIRHVQKKCKCTECQQRFKQKDISIVAATKAEALFELKCQKCGLITIITVVNTILKEPEFAPVSSNVHAISSNDVLDMKNLLNNFDGNFKKLFKP